MKTLALILLTAIGLLTVGALGSWALYDGLDVGLFHHLDVTLRPLSYLEVVKVAFDFCLTLTVVFVVGVVVTYLRYRVPRPGPKTVPPLYPVTKIHVNGREVDLCADTLTYEQVVGLARAREALTYPAAPTVVWYVRGQNHKGSLLPGQSVKVEPGLVISAMDTSRA